MPAVLEELQLIYEKTDIFASPTNGAQTSKGDVSGETTEWEGRVKP